MRTPFPPLETELAAERAATLGRNGRRLQSALERVREFDRGAGRERPVGPAAAESAEDLAAEAFFCLIVQRESLGLVDADRVAVDYGVSREILTRVGIYRPARRSPACPP
jgi:hypothetical protein